jgi:aspartate-semialdehyde dehydrogenase
MADSVHRVGIVGATSLAGRELSEVMQESQLAAAEVVLLDDDEGTEGQLTATGDEAAFIQKVEEGAFERLDFVFFTGDGARTRQHWPQARRSGASIVDMTYALEGEKDVLVRSPLAEMVIDGPAKSRGASPDLKTPGVVAAHPAAVMLAIVAGALKAKLPVSRITATVMEPASEHGRAAMDELHQQTVNLLSFQNVPQEQFDTQVAFNLLPELGRASKVNLVEVGRRIQEHYRLLGQDVLPPVEVQMVQAPVFHGYAASVMVELDSPVKVEDVEAALSEEAIEIATEEPPSNLSVTGMKTVMVRVNGDAKGPTKWIWLWMAVDNLKLAAMNAISCALELSRLRPSGNVQ